MNSVTAMKHSRSSSLIEENNNSKKGFKNFQIRHSGSSNIAEGVDVVQMALTQLNKYAQSDAVEPKKLQTLYRRTILLCATYERKEAFDLLGEFIEKNICNEERARDQFFAKAICALAKKDFPIECIKICSKAMIERGVWKNSPELREKAYDAMRLQWFTNGVNKDEIQVNYTGKS